MGNLGRRQRATAIAKTHNKPRINQHTHGQQPVYIFVYCKLTCLDRLWRSGPCDNGGIMPRRSGLMSGGSGTGARPRWWDTRERKGGQQGKTNFGLNLPRHPSTLRGRVGDLPPESHSPSHPASATAIVSL